MPNLRCMAWLLSVFFVGQSTLKSLHKTQIVRELLQLAVPMKRVLFNTSKTLFQKGLINLTLSDAQELYEIVHEQSYSWHFPKIHRMSFSKLKWFLLYNKCSLEESLGGAKLTETNLHKLIKSAISICPQMSGTIFKGN